tara:strand:+ start:1253 stop:1585 length:333 start_codon:yes stop_codon:yes gene_type:complete
MKKVKFPTTIDVSYHKIQIRLINSHLSQEVGEQQGCYVARDMIIYLDEDIINQGGTRGVSLILHEVGHALFYIFNLAAAEEERAVDSFANGYTEVLTRNPQLKKWINQNT